MLKESERNLVDVLKYEKNNKISNGIHHKIQIELTYNSNRMEGSSLTHEQTRYIYETNTIGNSEAIKVDDIIETANHFRCIDLIIDNINEPLSEDLIKKLHFILKTSTTDSKNDWFMVGDYKKYPNEVGGQATTLPEDVEVSMKKLLEEYNKIPKKEFKDIIEFHYKFEKIHPFQDGNGRIGRLIMFKECLKNNEVPFIIKENLKMFYYRGLSLWEEETGYLIETCLSAQDDFKEYMTYFRLQY